MPLAREQRKLAAIVAADVVGYSRLMGRDESGTLARLRKNRSEHLDSVLTKYGGRLVKLTGDGALVEFGSAVDALSAAIEFQQAMAEANGGLPTDTALVFRMGLHLGDLIVDGDDLYGDGVNIAARLEAEAPAGGIVISSTVHEAVARRLKATFEDLGSLALKNIERAVQAFSVKWEPSDWQLPVTSEVTVASATALQVPLPLPDKPSIAVLPFQNMSGDPEQEYFVDGLVEDIITALSRFKSLFVIARNSSFVYKGKSPDVRQVGCELGVRYVLEGSVRKAGNRIRITGQLVDAAKGIHLWADRFDGALEDVFELQDRVAASVVGVIAPRIEQAEIERVRSKPAGNLEAYDLVLRALALMQSLRRPEIEQALSLLRQAVQIDPGYARGAVDLSSCCHLFIAQGFGHRDNPLVADLIELARRAVALDPSDSYVLAVAGSVLGLTGDMDTGLALAEKAIRLNPNNAMAFKACATFYAYKGEVDRTVEHQQQCERLDPMGTAGWGGSLPYVIAYFCVGDYEKVVDWTARILREHPNAAPALRYGAASLALLGRTEEARQVIVRLLEHAPGFSIFEVRRHLEFDVKSPFKKPGVTESLYRGLRLAGLPE
jgi:TolB-like protein/class 3 adenylate cyclase